jgi:FlaA1/EpsC-like NDP-sugar epimerase
MSRFANHREVIPKLGDVMDRRAIESVMNGCDIVFHAAALKHVQFCEMNPYEAIMTNIVGTQNVIDLALHSSVQRFVFMSTDKAVNPASTMGITKLLGEKLTIKASTVTDRPIFSVVRFGNVIGSVDSVVLVFEHQVRSGHEITVTDPDMTRFIMLPSDAARLVLEAGQFPESGRTLALKMKAVRIGDLADACREFFTSLYGRDAGSVKITRISAGLGEKTHEELMTEAEALMAIETNDLYIIKPATERDAPSGRDSGNSQKGLISNSVELLSKDRIVSLLSQLYCR